MRSLTQQWRTLSACPDSGPDPGELNRTGIQTEGLTASSRGKLCDLVSRDWVSEFLCIHMITRKLYTPSVFSGKDLDNAIPTTQVHAISWMTRINTLHKKSVVKTHIYYDYFEMGVSLCCPGWLQMDHLPPEYQ